jgi:deazaflavin-dependent oxidoreductase (nitroreductase family)
MRVTIVVLILLVVPPLLVRFFPRWIARFNLAVTNRITAQFVTWLPGFGMITHIGRKSGREYRTPVNVFRRPNGFLIALTYGPNSEWVKNILAAGGAELLTRHTRYHLSDPEVVHDPSRRQFPLMVRTVLRILGRADFLRVSATASSGSPDVGDS